MVNARVFHREMTEKLNAAGIPDAAFDVRCMMEQVTGKRLEMLFLHDFPQECVELVEMMMQRRISHEPLQYILGEWEFFGMRFLVGKGVLIPRPDTEILVESVLDWCSSHTVHRILDLCTGSGCIALALKKCLPDAEIHAVDYSRTALDYAKKNARLHELEIFFHFQDVENRKARNNFPLFDVIVSNPPYLSGQEMSALQAEVRHEPFMALSGGTDGLDFYRSITKNWKHVLGKGGLLSYEIGETQGSSVSGILRENQFANVRILQDLAGNDRVVLGEKLHLLGSEP